MLIKICPNQIAAPIVRLLIIHIITISGVNSVNISIVNCLIINFTFSLKNKYANNAITIAVAIAFPVCILLITLFPSNSSNPPFAYPTIICTRLLFNNNKNFTNSGAIPIDTAPKNNRIKLSFASLRFSILYPPIINL